MCDTFNDATRPTGELSTPTPSTPECIEDNECENSDAICNNDYSNCNYCDEGTCKPGCSTNANSKGTWFAKVRISANNLAVLSSLTSLSRPRAALAVPPETQSRVSRSS